MAVIPGRPPHCSSVTSVYLVVAIRFLAKNILRAVLKSASTLGGVPMAVPPSQRAPKALRPFFLDFLAIYCKQKEKDFYRCREEAERNKALIEQRRQDKAVHTKAVADELVALDEGLCCHGVRKAPHLEGWECEDGGGIQCDDEVGRDGGSEGVGL